MEEIKIIYVIRPDYELFCDICEKTLIFSYLLILCLFLLIKQHKLTFMQI